MFCGYAPEPVVGAVSERIAARQPVPAPDRGRDLGREELGRRYGLPKWQFTLSATHANTEAIRVARVMTGREQGAVLRREVPRPLRRGAGRARRRRRARARGARPAAPTSPSGTVIVPFNDLERARARRSSRGDIAIVMTEPAMTNNIGLLLPETGFHDALRRLTRETGTLLAYDETHTQVVGPGGLTALWGLEPDIVTVGKSIAGGVPFGAWGMTDEVAEYLDAGQGPRRRAPRLVATGGTLFGNALVDGGRAGDDARGAHARGVRAHAAPRRATRRRHASERRRARAALARSTASGPRPGYTFRPTPIRERRRGPRGRRRAAHAADPGLAREPRRVGGDRRRGAGRARCRRPRRTSTPTSRRGTRCSTPWSR